MAIPTTHDKESCIPLLLIFLLAFILRLPGLFWGLCHANSNYLTVYHPDESHQSATIAKEFLTKHPNKNEFYAKGFGFQVAAIASILKPWFSIDFSKLILIGRSLSLMYGLLLILLLYFLAYEIFKDRLIALLSSLFLALTGLSIVQSHYATVDSSTAFWIYATLYSCLLYVRQSKNVYIVFGLLSAGITLALKFSVWILLPIFYAGYRKKGLLFLLFALLALVVIFIGATGGYYSFSNLTFTFKNLYEDNLQIFPHGDKLGTVLFYIWGLFPALGLAHYISLLLGIGFFLKNGWRKLGDTGLLFTFILPLSVYLILICCLDIHVSRHLLPLTPCMAMIAAYGISQIKKFIRPSILKSLLVVVVLYQLFYAANIEYYYIFETRKAASEWIIKNISKDKTIHLSSYAKIPRLDGYKLTGWKNADYVVLHERDCLRYVRGDMEIPSLKSTYPSVKWTYHGNSTDLFEIQRIFRGKSPFTLRKRFSIQYLTLENFLYKKYFGGGFIGDTLILQRR